MSRWFSTGEFKRACRKRWFMRGPPFFSLQVDTPKHGQICGNGAKRLMAIMLCSYFQLRF
jgi:hypothetical protein